MANFLAFDLGMELAEPFEETKELFLSVRANNVLRNKGIKTVGQLITVSEAELLREPNCGKVTVNEIKAALASIGLQLSKRQFLNPDSMKRQFLVRDRKWFVLQGQKVLASGPIIKRQDNDLPSNLSSIYISQNPFGDNE